jgi:hypothetical protein
MSDGSVVYRGWGEVEEGAKGDGGDFRRLGGHDDFVSGILVGEPYGRVIHYDQSTDTWSDCTGKGCAGCARGLAKNKRFWLNLFCLSEGTGQTAKDGTFKMEVLETSSRGIQNMIPALKKFAQDEWSFEIRRQGAKGDTKTTYNVLPDKKIEDLPADTLKAFRAAEEIDLDALNERLKGGGGGGSAPGEDLPPMGKDAPALDVKAKAEVANMLKPFGTQGAREALAKVGVKTVSELKPSDLPKLFEVISSMSSASEEVDPLS